MANGIAKIGAVALVILLSLTALAACESDGSGEEKYPYLYVGDDGPKEKISGVSWDKESHTLTIENLTVYDIGFQMNAIKNVTLLVKGDCKILDAPNTNYKRVSGLRANVPLTITGDSLYVKGTIGRPMNENGAIVEGDLVIDGMKSLTIDGERDVRNSAVTRTCINWSFGDIIIKKCAKIDMTSSVFIINRGGPSEMNERKSYDIHIENSALIFNVTSFENGAMDPMLIACLDGYIYCDEPSGMFYCSNDVEVTKKIPFESGKVSYIFASGDGITITLGHYGSNSALVVAMIIVALVVVGILGIYFRSKGEKVKL